MIRARTLLVCIAVLVLPGVVSAQTTFYGTLMCVKASNQHKVAAKGKPNGKTSSPANVKPDPPASASAPASDAEEQCSWTLPLEIAMDMAQNGQNSFNSNITGHQSKDTGSHTSRMTNSDQFTISLSGSSVFDDSGEPRSRVGTWMFTSGTGLLKGITGSGTYEGIARAEGGMSYDIEGEYEFPKPPAASPAPSQTPQGKSSS